MSTPRRRAGGRARPSATAGRALTASLLISADTTAMDPILRKALNDASRDEVLGLRRNVVTLVEAPRVARGGKGRPLELGQVAAVLEVIDQDPCACCG